MSNKLVDIIASLAATASLLEKQAILTKHKGREDLKLLFLWTYNPMINYYIKKLPEIKQQGKQSLDDEDVFDSFASLLVELSERNVTGNAAIAQAVEFLGHLNSQDRELAIKVLFRDLRCNVTDTTANKVWPNLIPTFEVQLANTYDPEKPSADEYWLSPKMDGLRGIYIFGSGIFTRQGKKIHGFDFIEAELHNACDILNVGAIDGELFTTEIDFAAIQGAVMRDKNIREDEKKKIRFNVFALVKDFHTREVFSNSNEMVKVIDLMFKTKYKYLLKVPQILVTPKDIDKTHDQFVAQGYEGVMLRSVKVSYDFKRSKNLLKYKKFLEEDFEVVGFLEGKGKHEGRLGAIMVEGKISGVKIASEVGSGFTDEERTDFWKKQKSLLGQKVEIKFQGVTPDLSLRFPVFLKFKLDR